MAMPPPIDDAASTLNVRRQVARTDRRAAGFTLIEILIVLVVIGISIALVSVNLQRDPKSELRDEARQLALLLQAAQSEAINTGKALAWIAAPAGHGFYSRDQERQWTVAIDDPPFVQSQWPARVALADLSINHTQVPIATPLVFSASGSSTPFALLLTAGGERIQVTGDAVGRIRAVEVTNVADAPR